MVSCPHWIFLSTTFDILLFCDCCCDYVFLFLPITRCTLLYLAIQKHAYICSCPGWDTQDEEFELFKLDYYVTKLHLPREAVSALFREDFGKSYVLGLQWVLYYYMNGVPSWSWFYNSHYAPFVSDLRNLADFVPHFDLGVPFLPFQQLLSVMVGVYFSCVIDLAFTCAQI